MTTELGCDRQCTPAVRCGLRVACRVAQPARATEARALAGASPAPRRRGDTRACSPSLLRLFFPHHPMPASVTPALALARRLLDVRHPLSFSVINAVSGAAGLPPATVLNLAAGSYHGVFVGTILFIASATCVRILPSQCLAYFYDRLVCDRADLGA